MSDDRELSALYHSADKAQPSAALDHAVRSAAHKALKPRRSHAPRWFGGIAASFLAALLVTQLLPTIEQEEADVSPEAYDAPRPAADAVAPGRMRTEETPRPAASKAVPKKSEMKRMQTREKALTVEEADMEIRAPGLQQATPISPGAELQTIFNLMDSGKLQEARQHLEDFRERYPDTEIPEAIARRLEIPVTPRKQ